MTSQDQEDMNTFITTMIVGCVLFYTSLYRDYLWVVWDLSSFCMGILAIKASKLFL